MAHGAGRALAKERTATMKGRGRDAKWAPRGWEGAGSRAMAVPTAAKDCRRGAYELPSYVLALALARIAARRAERTTKDRVARTLANIPGQGVEGQSGNSLIASAPHVFTTNIATERGSSLRGEDDEHD